MSPKTRKFHPLILLILLGTSAPHLRGDDREVSEQFLRTKLQGVVILSFVVNTEGIPEDISIVRPLGMGLDEKAVERVQTWKFKPGMRHGSPVPVRLALAVTFRLF